jgi:endonuclease YncB( thermonuclease family)
MKFPTMTLKWCSLLSIALNVLWALTAIAGALSGQVVRVLDGDLLEIHHQGKTERIRLNGIDCPEKGQAYGERAKQATSELVAGKDVMLNTYGPDKDGRTIADVLLLDGTNVNYLLVREGWCWWYRKYAPGNRKLEGLEKEARDRKKGLWAEPNPVPPWEWRKRRRTSKP